MTPAPACVITSIGVSGVRGWIALTTACSARLGLLLSDLPCCNVHCPRVALQAETAYTRSVLRDTEELQEQLYKEMRGRIQEADQGVPQRLVPASLAQ